jgi:DNA-binding response OmpR family regulator
MRVLVVEHDRAISGVVVRGLREERYVVDLAEDGTFVCWPLIRS